MAEGGGVFIAGIDMDFLLEIKNAILHFWFVKVILGGIALFWLAVVLQKIFNKSKKSSPRPVTDSNDPEIDIDDSNQESSPFDEDEVI